MENYMRQAEMPWPAVVFERVAVKLPVAECPRSSFPDSRYRDARFLFSSTGVQNVDPAKVIADLDKILATSSADPKAPPPLMLSNTRDYFRTQIK